MGKTHHPSSILSRWTIAVVTLFMGTVLIYAAVNYTETFPNDTSKYQSQANGWVTPQSSTKEIMVIENGVSTCKRIASTTSTQMFIPTRTEAEWVSFRNNTPLGVTISSCSTYSWQTSGWGSCSGETGTWNYSDWGACSVSCGGGNQTRSASCNRGNNGTQTRTVSCQRSDGTTVDDSYCTGTKPSNIQYNCTQGTDVVCGSATTSQSCNTQACPPPGGSCIAPAIEASTCDDALPSGNAGSCSAVIANLTSQGYTNCLKEVQGFGPVCCEPPSCILSCPSGTRLTTNLQGLPPQDGGGVYTQYPNDCYCVSQSQFGGSCPSGWRLKKNVSVGAKEIDYYFIFSKENSCGSPLYRWVEVQKTDHCEDSRTPYLGDPRVGYEDYEGVVCTNFGQIIYAGAGDRYAGCPAGEIGLKELRCQ